MTTACAVPEAPWPCLVLLCKRPALGHSKQRLARQVGLPAAFAIARHLLACALEDLAEWPGHSVLAPDHGQHLAWAQGLAAADECLSQGAGNLGERINQLDRCLRQQGQQRLIYIGSDCPVLCLADYQRVANLLQTHDTVLMRARDGGVVLLASNLPWPELRALPWSSERLAEALYDCCHAAGQRIAWAGELFDIDHQQDLQPLHGCLGHEVRPARLALRRTLEQLAVLA